MLCCTGSVLLLQLIHYASCRLNIITLTATRNSGSGAPHMISAFEIAAEDIAEKYPILYKGYNITHLYWELDGPSVCIDIGDWLVPVKMAEWYGANKFNDDNGVTIIVTSVCNWALPNIFDFAREMDIMIVPCAAGVAINRQRSPNAVSVAAASYLIFGAAIGKIMDRFQWRYLAVINDHLTKKQEGARSLSECNGLIIDLNKRVEIQRFEIDVDSTAEGFSFKPYLEKAANYSRIIMCCTLYVPMRRLLAEAHDLNMTNGDIVFMMLYEGQIPMEPPITDWQRNDEYDDRVYKALDNVVLFRTPKTDWNRFLATSRRVIQRREAKFGTPYEEERVYNDWHFQCHEAVEVASLVKRTQSKLGIRKPCCDVFHKAISETLAEMHIGSAERIDRHLPVADMARRITNRTHKLMFEDVYITPAAEKEPILWVQQFDFARNEAVTVLHYDYKTDTYPLVSQDISFKWRTGQVPPDRPLCGLHGDMCLSGLSIGLIVGVVTVVILLGVSGLLAGIIWRWQKKGNIRQTWWIVLPSEVEHVRSAVSTISVKNPVLSRFSQPGNIASGSFEKRVVILRTVMAVKTPLRELCNRQSSVHDEFISFLNNFRKLDAPNVNKLLGLDATSSPPVMFYQWCERGSLVDLLLIRSPDWALKLFLVQGLIEGLFYIHKSRIAMHGNLRPTKCLLDNHLSIKISDYAHQTVCQLLSGSSNQTSYPCSSFPHYWMAPEVFRGQILPASDVYAFGIITQQILMGYRSVDVSSLDQSDDSARAMHRQQPAFSDGLKQGTVSPFIDLVEKCWLSEPTLRPHMSEVQDVFAHATLSEGLQGTLIERVMRWLKTYNEILEKEVAKKTAQLQLEQRRADELLGEMLPTEVVRKLRAGLPVQPEYVDEVSVLFSDITGFAEYIAGCPPDAALNFLHVTYIHFDKVISTVSVYKLETIGSSYVAVSGLVERIGKRHASEICQLALLLQETFRRVIEDSRLGLLIGLHSGPVAVGVVGWKRPRYCLFGDTVNTASRMESNGLPGRIHVSPDMAPLAEMFGHVLEHRGSMEIKGKGMISTYWLVG